MLEPQFWSAYPPLRSGSQHHIPNPPFFIGSLGLQPCPIAFLQVGDETFLRRLSLHQNVGLSTSTRMKTVPLVLPKMSTENGRLKTLSIVGV